MENGHSSAVVLQNAHGELPIHIVFTRKNTDSLSNTKLMFKHLQNFDQQTADGNTPLHIALKNDLGVDIIQYLIKKVKCSISIANNEGDLPLHIACRYTSYEKLRVLKLLTSKEIINTQNKKGNTALHECCFNILYFPVDRYIVLFD